ncbi:hypothetical protein BH10PSE19_BH10PSE19_06820 [soil metagenome]
MPAIRILTGQYYRLSFSGSLEDLPNFLLKKDYGTPPDNFLSLEKLQNYATKLQPFDQTPYDVSQDINTVFVRVDDKRWDKVITPAFIVDKNGEVHDLQRKRHFWPRVKGLLLIAGGIGLVMLGVAVGPAPAIIGIALAVFGFFHFALGKSRETLLLETLGSAFSIVATVLILVATINPITIVSAIALLVYAIYGIFQIYKYSQMSAAERDAISNNSIIVQPTTASVPELVDSVELVPLTPLDTIAPLDWRSHASSSPATTAASFVNTASLEMAHSPIPFVVPLEEVKQQKAGQTPASSF